MIGTLPANANPREELRERLASLLTVEVPRLEAEVECESELAVVALEQSIQEIHDILRLQAALDAMPKRTDDDVVRLNDCVTIRAYRSRQTETLIVHDPELQIRARGFISVDSPLGAAILGRRVGESIEVRAPGTAPKFIIEKLCCA